MEAPHHQRMGDRHHQGRVGAGDARYPFGAGFVRQVCPQRTHQDELAAAGPGARHGGALDMLADAAAGDHAVLEGHAAEGEHDVAMLGDLVPGDVALRQVLVVADDMRNENRGGAGAVAVDGADIAPQRGIQKAVELALRVVETSRARPAIGSAEDRAGTMVISYPGKLRAQKVENGLPGHRHILVAAAAIVGAGAAFQPAAAHHGLGDAGAMMEGAGEVFDDLVGIGIAGMRPDFEPAILPARRKNPPMGGVGQESVISCTRALKIHVVLSCAPHRHPPRDHLTDGSGARNSAEPRPS